MRWGAKAGICGPVLALIVLLTMGIGDARAQGEAEAVLQTTEDALHAMVQQAAVIFVGQVTAVRRRDGANGSTGMVEVDFAVKDAVRGVSSSTYTLREWAGLWAGGEQPLRIGQLYLMLLHAPSAAGLSSPVGGADGAIPIRGSGESGTPNAEPLALPRTAGASATSGVPATDTRTTDSRTVDLRWIATRVARPATYAADSPARPTALPAGVHANVIAASVTQESAPIPSSADPEGGDTSLAQSGDYATVLSLLRSWVKTDAAR